MASAEDTSAIECGFCFRRDGDLEKPRVLPCTHVHCLECLTAYFDINHVAKCPKPDCGVLVTGSLDTLPSPDVTYGKATHCNTCADKHIGNQPAVVYCINCERMFCAKHEESHADLLSGHEVITITDYLQQSAKCQTKECKEHRLPFSVGCKSCLTLACVNGISTLGPCKDGKSHTLSSLDELVTALVENGIKAEMIAKEEKLEKLFKVTSRANCEFKVKTAEMLQQLRDTRDEQLGAIREKYDRLEEELVEKRQIGNLALTEFLEEKVLTTWAHVRNQRHKVETVLKHTHKVDIVKRFTELKAEQQQLLERELPTFVLENFVELNGQAESRDIEVDVVTSGCMTIDSKGDHVSHIRLPTSMQHLHTVKLSSPPLSLCLYKGNTYVGLRDGGIARIDSSYQVHKSFASTDPVECISAYEDKLYTVVRSKPYKICVFDMAGNEVTQWKATSGKSFRNALSIVSGDIVITDASHKRLTIYSLAGEVLRHVPCSLLGDDYIFSCAVDSSSIVISGSKTSKVFRVNVKTGRVSWATDVNEARGVCCYGDKYIFIGHYHSKSMQILDCETGSKELVLENPSHRSLTCVYGLQVFDSLLVFAGIDRISLSVPYYQLMYN